MKNNNSKSKKPSSDDYLQKSLFDRYQRIIRHPVYRCFCDTYEEFFTGKREEKSIDDRFDNHSFWDTYENLSIDETNKESINLLLNKIRKRNLPYHYFLELYEEFSREEIEEENIRLYLGEIKYFTEIHEELLAIIEKFKLSSTIIHYHYGLLLSEKDMVALPLFKEPIAVQFQFFDELIDRNNHVVTLVKDQHFISAKINISPEVPFHQICAEIKSAIESARSATGEYSEKKRGRFDENLIAYQAFDLREQGLRYEIIKERLGLESKQSAQNKVRRAYELIGIKPPTDEDLARQGRWNEIAPDKGQREQTYADVNNIRNRSNTYPTENIQNGRNNEEKVDRILTAICDGVDCLCLECPDDVCKEKKLSMIKEINNYQDSILIVDKLKAQPFCDKLKKSIRSHLL